MIFEGPKSVAAKLKAFSLSSQFFQFKFLILKPINRLKNAHSRAWADSLMNLYSRLEAFEWSDF